MFQAVPLSIIRSFSLHTQQRCMSYRFADSLRAEWNWVPSCSRAVSSSYELMKSHICKHWWH